MDPITALGVGAAVVAFVDFAAKLASGAHKFATGAERDDIDQLHQIARHLAVIGAELESEQPQEAAGGLQIGKGNRDGRADAARPKVSLAEEELSVIRQECRLINNDLRTAVGHLGTMERGDSTSFRDMLAAVWSPKRVGQVQSRLEGIRQRLDTSLLACIKNSLSDSPAQSAGPLRKGEKSKIDLDSGLFQPWQTDILKEIRRHNWTSDDSQDVAHFSTQLDAVVSKRKIDNFDRLILSQLDFGELLDREEGIMEAHEATFNWLFEGNDEPSQKWINFPSWLSSPHGGTTYWITGKPGSGKSTLMKYLSRDLRAKKLVAQWADDREVLTASFFFWNSGSKMQMSRMGLLQAILYQLLRRRRASISEIFPRRWDQYDAYGGGAWPWNWSELKQAFELLLSNERILFFLAIDGLDELHGDHQELVELVVAAGKRPNVKICCASRPWLVFEDAFKHGPSLLIEKLTENDITAYILDKFTANEHYRRLRDEEPTYANDLLENLAAKSSGVFLWVYLVVSSLLVGLRNSDRLSDLHRRLDALPSELEDLFRKLLNSLDPFYAAHACQLIRTLEDADQDSRVLSLLQFYFADEEDPLSAINARFGPLSEEDTAAKEESMRRRLNSRCKGFLEVTAGTSLVRYLHRTARDYIRTPEVWVSIVTTSGKDFDPALGLANASLRGFKGVDQAATDFNTFWGQVQKSLCYAGRVKLPAEAYLVSFLDELDTTASRLVKGSWLSRGALVWGDPTQPHYPDESERLWRDQVQIRPLKHWAASDLGVLYSSTKASTVNTPLEITSFLTFAVNESSLGGTDDKNSVLARYAGAKLKMGSKPATRKFLKYHQESADAVGTSSLTHSVSGEDRPSEATFSAREKNVSPSADNTGKEVFVKARDVQEHTNRNSTGSRRRLLAPLARVCCFKTR